MFWSRAPSLCIGGLFIYYLILFGRFFNPPPPLWNQLSYFAIAFTTEIAILSYLIFKKILDLVNWVLLISNQNISLKFGNICFQPTFVFAPEQQWLATKTALHYTGKPQSIKWVKSRSLHWACSYGGQISKG